jgi:flavin reductase (DIM6/NTAB) family NADH-FMN oxidoreductase RutF
MNVCATDFPAGVSELPSAGFTPTPSTMVRPPRIAESPVHLECREVQTIAIGDNRIVMGEVVHIQVRDDLIDRDRMYVKTEQIHAVGRMHAPNWYTRTHELFEMKRK